MPDEQTHGKAGRIDSTTLAMQRTALALERTLMASVRTATSLISFGFTIYKFFQHLSETGGVPPRPRLLGPRELGMVMISLAVVMLVLSTLRYGRSLLALRKANASIPRSPAMLLSFQLTGLAILALLAVIFRQ